MADPAPVSLRSRLLALSLAAVAAVWAVTVWFTYKDARGEMNDVMDAHLAQAAAILLAQSAHELDELELEHVEALHPYARQVAFQVWDKDGDLLLHSENAPDTPLTEIDGFGERPVAGERWRVFSSWDRERRLRVQVGERAALREQLAESLVENMLRPMLLALPALGLLIWLAVGAGLRPLQALARQMGERDPRNLKPLEPSIAPREALPLVDELNRLLSRVAGSLEHERRFTADAAHELRTPLAAVRAQAQVARGATVDAERARALDGVIAGCDRATRLVEQLLTLARLEQAPAVLPQTCSLREIAVGIVAGLAPKALEKDIRVELAGEAAGEIRGHPGLLEVLLRNLVDNAVRYSPPGSVVEVAVGERQLTVSDGGPGIPEEERARVLQRFYRLPGSGEEGSGLGLSIVQRIAEIHGAQLCLGEGEGERGLKVVVTFPRPAVIPA